MMNVQRLSPKSTVLMTTGAIALIAGIFWSASPARADLISIGLQEAGVNGGAITTEATGSAAASLGPIVYGTFSLNQASAQDTAGIGLPVLLNSQSLNTSTSTGGTLHVFITAQGLIDPVGLRYLLSSFTANDLTGQVTSVEEQTFLNAGNTLYGTTTPLSSATFTGIGTSSPSSVLENLAGPFSVTEEYTITAAGQGNANLTIDLKAVPEPASLALLASGLFGFGWYRRGRRAVSA